MKCCIPFNHIHLGMYALQRSCSWGLITSLIMQWAYISDEEIEKQGKWFLTFVFPIIIHHIITLYWPAIDFLLNVTEDKKRIIILPVFPATTSCPGKYIAGTS